MALALLVFAVLMAAWGGIDNYLAKKDATRWQIMYQQAAKERAECAAKTRR